MLVSSIWCHHCITVKRRLETFRLNIVCCDIILQFYAKHHDKTCILFNFMEFHDQMIIYWSVTNNGLIGLCYSFASCYSVWWNTVIPFGYKLKWHSFGYYFYVDILEKQQVFWFWTLFVEVVPVQFSISSQESCVLANPVPVQWQKYITWMFLGWHYGQDS